MPAITATATSLEERAKRLASKLGTLPPADWAYAIVHELIDLRNTTREEDLSTLKRRSRN